ncbi:hypothetical protein [Motiliproteus sediminis]|uniref:hypothetical protein n=1 Tax=Motiliproteus sediminis TaxID=1468178 RepID=UPI001AEFBF9A|nr:hypothetical protein [Motiliproteus sediminis]
MTEWSEDGPGNQRPPNSASAPKALLPVRWGWFAVLVMVFGTIALAWVWSRPALYESHALLQVQFPPRYQSALAESPPEEMVLHQQVLLSHPLLQTLQQQLGSLGVVVTLDELRSNLQVEVLPNSQLVRLVAQAGDPALAPSVVERWITLYQQRFSQRQDQITRAEGARLDERVAELERMQQQVQQELETYQREHQIASIERDENRVMNRIRGLAESLDRIAEQRRRAEAERDALLAAKRRGEILVQAQDQAGIDNLSRRAVQIKDQLQTLEEQYTRRYLQINPEAQALQHRLRQIEAQIDERQRQSLTQQLQRAQRQVDSSRAQEQVMLAELAAQNDAVRQFEGRLLTLQARREQLALLNTELATLRNQRLAFSQAPRRDVRIHVLEPAVSSTRTVAPDYWRDSGWALLLAALLALALSILKGMMSARLLHGARLPAPPVPGPPRVIHSVGVAPLSVATCRELLRCADQQERLLIMLLLSGVQLREVSRLAWYHLADGCERLSVPSLPPRELSLAPALSRSLRQSFEGPDQRLQPLLVAEDGHPLSPDQLDERLAATAERAQLRDRDISGEQLAHTYLCFLAEQGAGLEQLERRLGPLPVDVLDPLQQRLPAGPARMLEEINPHYPALL